MCTGAEIGLILGGVSAASSVYQMATAPKASQAAAPAIQAPIAPPESQAAQTPVQSAATRRGTQGIAGIDPTALTGPQGIGNDKLTLGKATVLGS